jgi:CheY-like chemotaxis protein
MVNKVLIVDDNREDLESMKVILEKNNCEVVTASNGAEAIDQLVSDGFKVALIDIKMPTLSGYDLARLLKERVKHKVRIIYVSIVPLQEVDMDGVDGFIQKPFSPESLMAEVNKTL